MRRSAFTGPIGRFEASAKRKESSSRIIPLLRSNKINKAIRAMNNASQVGGVRYRYEITWGVV